MLAPWLCGMLCTTAGLAADREFAVIGYLPEYRFEKFDFDRARMATDVVLFSLEPRADGSLDTKDLTDAVVRSAVQKLQNRGCKVHVTIGGWGHSTAFSTVTADEGLRLTVARNIVDYCERHGLDGVDIDWEHPRTDAEREQYGKFLTDLKSALEPHGRSLSIAIAPWERLAPASITAVDRIHLMAYDNGGRHSTFEYAEESLGKLAAQQVPPEKICLGIPFYGRPFRGEFGAGKTYAEISAGLETAPDSDELNGIYFNGPSMVASKTRLARDRGLGGVMIWELGQDHPNADLSLLHAIDAAVPRHEVAP
jgi:GH18 family chitinase